MSVINIIDPDHNFWKLYPELKKIEDFKFIQKEYKTKSSDVMWFIVLCFDLDSRFMELPIDDRTTLLSQDYLKDKNWYKENEKKLQPVITTYENLTDSVSSRQLRQLRETMEKRTKFLREAEYSLDNFEKLDKMAANTANLFTVFEKIEKQLSKEKGASITKGGHELSLADAEEI